jgi:hypothetical protein
MLYREYRLRGSTRPLLKDRRPSFFKPAPKKLRYVKTFTGYSPSFLCGFEKID